MVEGFTVITAVWMDPGGNQPVEFAGAAQRSRGVYVFVVAVEMLLSAFLLVP